MMNDTDELSIRRAKKLLEAGDLYVREVRMWDGNTWHVVVVDTDTDEETKLESVETRDALPFIQALETYAKLVVAEGLYD